MENDAPHCEFMCVHADTVDRITSTMPDEDTLIDLSELFKVFGDSTRIKILTRQAGNDNLRTLSIAGRTA